MQHVKGARLACLHSTCIACCAALDLKGEASCWDNFHGISMHAFLYEAYVCNVCDYWTDTDNCMIAPVHVPS